MDADGRGWGAERAGIRLRSDIEAWLVATRSDPPTIYRAMADTKHTQPWEPSAEKVAKAIELHAAWLDSDGADGERLDLGRADLRKFGSQLRGARLDKAILTQCDLRGADITGVRFVKANLLGAKLEGATIRRANLTRANFTGAEIAGADFSESVWNRATFVNALGEAALFCKCRIDVNAAVKEGPNFSSANLPGVWFSSANLSNGQLAHAIMPSAHAEEAVFDNAQMGEIDLSDRRADRRAVLDTAGPNRQSAQLRGASFRHATIPAGNLQGADCRQANFSSALSPLRIRIIVPLVFDVSENKEVSRCRKSISFD